MKATLLRSWSAFGLFVLTLLAIAIAIAIAIAGVGVVARSSPTWTSVEQGMVAKINGFHAPALDALAFGIDISFGPRWAVPLAALVGAVVLIATRSWLRAVVFAALVGIPWRVVDVMKVVVQRPRPVMALLPHPSSLESTTFSFPSGHVAFAAALVCAIVATIPRTWRPPVTAAGAVVVLAAAWSRVYLGPHFPLDVLASAVLVPVVSSALVRFFEKVRKTAQASAFLGHPFRSGAHAGSVDSRTDGPDRPASYGER